MLDEGAKLPDVGRIAADPPTVAAVRRARRESMEELGRQRIEDPEFAGGETSFDFAALD